MTTNPFLGSLISMAAMPIWSSNHAVDRRKLVPLLFWAFLLLIGLKLGSEFYPDITSDVFSSKAQVTQLLIQLSSEEQVNVLSLWSGIAVLIRSRIIFVSSDFQAAKPTCLGFEVTNFTVGRLQMSYHKRHALEHGTVGMVPGGQLAWELQVKSCCSVFDLKNGRLRIELLNYSLL